MLYFVFIKGRDWQLGGNFPALNRWSYWRGQSKEHRDLAKAKEPSARLLLAKSSVRPLPLLFLPSIYSEESSLARRLVHSASSAGENNLTIIIFSHPARSFVPPRSHLAAEHTHCLITACWFRVKSRKSSKDETLAVRFGRCYVHLRRLCVSRHYLGIHPSAAQIRQESRQFLRPLLPLWRLSAGSARQHHQLPDILFSFGY